MSDTIAQALADHVKTVQAIDADLIERLETASEAIVTALKDGHKVLAMGNGGSAADAQHLAGELVGRFLEERTALAAIALTSDTSILTAVANDYGYEAVFLRQIEGLAKSGDVVIGISTSGNSANVISALARAGELGCVTVGLTGGGGGEIARMTDHSLVIPSNHTPRIQEGHILVIHILCDLVEKAFL
jgi:D-sedoheptulose 7-phosphate isomerase